MLLQYVARTSWWQLTKALDQTLPQELKEMTLDTYTKDKKEFIATRGDGQIEKYKISDYVHRMEYELKVIHEMGFNPYFLTVADFITRAREHHIAVGPWRGSAVGSLVSYLTGITNLDPLSYNLLFERFLNPARISLPDIDIDFDDEGRDQVEEYARARYGYDNVVKIGTFMTMSAKAAFKDVARVMWVWFDTANMISSLLTETDTDKKVNIMKSFENNEQLKTLLEHNTILKKTIDITQWLIGTIRQIGVHACGIVIGQGDVTDACPIQYSPQSKTKGDTNTIITQYDGKRIEETGLIKMDFLWLQNLSTIKHTIRIIIAQHKADNKILPDIFVSYINHTSFEPNIADPLVYSTIFQKGDTSGIFQFESPGMRKFLVQLQPDNIEDVIAMSALYRPGPMEFIPSFIRRKHGEEEIRYMSDDLYFTLSTLYGKDVAESDKLQLELDLKDILGVTYGVAVYQEQLMLLVQSMAGFSLAEADNLRKWVGKKIREVIAKIKIEFVDKCQKYRGYKSETALWVFEKMIEPAALYSFNKSHAAAYSVIAHQTAWLKTYYPVEFAAALLRSAETNTDELSKFINEIKMSGIHILTPDINESYNHVAALWWKVRLGFLSIKWVGLEIGETIEKERTLHGRYTSLTDFLKRCHTIINKKSLEGLAKAGALGERIDTQTALNHTDQLIEWSKSSVSIIASSGLFGGGFVEQSLDFLPKISAPRRMDRIIFEYDVFKTFVSSHPLDGMYEYIKSKYNLISMFKSLENAGEFKIVAMVTSIQRAKKKGFYIKVEDISDTLEFFVKESLDVKLFDILIIEWYKSKSIKWKKVTTIILDDLIAVATNAHKYNATETVYEIRLKRLWWAKIEHHLANPGSDFSSLDTSNEEGNAKEEYLTDVMVDSGHDDIQEDQDDTKSLILTLPDDINRITTIQQLLHQHPGQIALSLENTTYHVSEMGLKSIQQIIW